MDRDCQAHSQCSRTALYEFGVDPEWDEWGAALYESYAADMEAQEATDIMSRNPAIVTSLYASIAHSLCERLEYAIYESTCPYCNILQKDIDAHMELCEPMY